MQKKMPSMSRFARTASRKPPASVRNPSALSVPADEYAHAPKPGTTWTPAVVSSTSRAPDTSLSRPRCAARNVVAGPDVEVVRLARDRVEGGDLLDALGDEDPSLADGHVET